MSFGLYLLNSQCNHMRLYHSLISYDRPVVIIDDVHRNQMVFEYSDFDCLILIQSLIHLFMFFGFVGWWKIVSSC